MGRRRHTPEQIITALREAEVGLANGKTVGMVSRELGISEQTYYRWRQEFAGNQDALHVSSPLGYRGNVTLLLGIGSSLSGSPDRSLRFPCRRCEQRRSMGLNAAVRDKSGQVY